MSRTLPILCAAALLAVAGSAFADPVNVSAIMTPEEQMKFDLGDGTPHFILAVRREGEATGEGAFAGMKVTEFGWHDVNPPEGADPRGYLRLTAANGDVAIVKWQVRAVFVKGAEGPRLLDSGFWELYSGTGAFAGRNGGGTLGIKPAGGPKREFTLVGEIGDAP